VKGTGEDKKEYSLKKASLRECKSCLKRRGQLFVCEKTRENLRNLEILKERGS